MKLDLNNKKYNFLVHQQGVTVLDDTEPIGVISIKDFLNRFRSNTMPMFSTFETNLPYQVLYSDPINENYLIKFPSRDQTITLSLTKNNTGSKIGINYKHKIKIIDVKLPEHYWYYNKNEYHLLVKRGDEFYTPNFYNCFDWGVCCQNLIENPKSFNDLYISYKEFWKSPFTSYEDYNEKGDVKLKIIPKKDLMKPTEVCYIDFD